MALSEGQGQRSNDLELIILPNGLDEKGKLLHKHSCVYSYT